MQLKLYGLGELSSALGQRAQDQNKTNDEQQDQEATAKGLVVDPVLSFEAAVESYQNKHGHEQR
jgi:hypothetical protein